jgi:diguanylate cyclase (GGDEF)-like protein
MRARGSITYLVVGIAFIGAYYLFPRAGVAQAVVLTCLNASAAIAAFVAAARTRGSARTMWLSLGAAMTLATLANGPYYLYPLVTARSLPFPSPLDALFLLTYPCYVVGLCALITQRRREDRRGEALDAAILTLAGASLMWQFVLEPVVHSSMPALAHAVSIGYPAMDLIVFAVLVRLVVGISGRNSALVLLVASFVALLAADVVYALQVAHATYTFGGPVDAIWMASYLLIGVAALHPARAFDSRRRPSPAIKHRVSRGRLAFVSASVLVGPVVTAMRPRYVAFIAGTTALSFVLVVARMAGLNRQLASVSLQLEARASTDSLTGLANRAAFRSALEATMTAAEPRKALSVLFVDLDDFKEVNDRLGHAAGDELLVAVARRLQRAVRPGDVVARLGGDEFAVLVAAAPDAATSRMVADRIIDTIAEPIELMGERVHVSASVGLAASRDHSDPDSLMVEADVAMYTAKSLGKNRVDHYDVTLHETVIAHQALKADLSAAVSRDEFIVEYQPVVDLATGTVEAVEALVRWQHPVRGLLPPSAFIGLAENSGAIVAIGSWVLETAVRQLANWQRRYGLRQLSVSVNVSMRQLDEPGFAESVHDVLIRTGLDPANLVVEVTETALAIPAGSAAAALTALRQLGVRVALDDFGTGYSSIGYLHSLPVDILKIDRSFVSGDQASTRDDVLLATIVKLGHQLGLDVIPEGIEQPSQLARLRMLGCRTGQGFLFSPPVSAAAVETLLGRPSFVLPQGITEGRAGVPIGAN